MATSSRGGPRRATSALVCVCAISWAILAPPPSAFAAATKIWVSDTASDFSSGEARGIAVGIDGSLVLSRDARRVDGVAEATLFGVASDKRGNVYLATGDGGRILKVSPAGKSEVFATLKEKEVTAIAVGPDGSVYAGGSPGGNVYRIERGAPAPYYDSKARYVWALVFAGNALYVGTGLPGEIHRVTAAGKGEKIHGTPDAHVRTLAVDRQGRLWAGTSGSGLVLRVDPSGVVSTVYDSSKSEITSIDAAPDGRVWVAAGSADASAGIGSEPISAPHETPATKPAKSTAAGAGDGDAKDKPEVTVSVSNARLAPPTSSSSKGGYSSEVLLFEEGEPPRAVWTSTQELVFGLEPSADSKSVLAATGPNGKLYRIAPGVSSLERTFDEKQVTALGADVVGTNSATGIYRLTEGQRQGDWVSAVKDTGRTSRFGAFRWEGDEPAGTKIEFAFRSGDSSNPDTTWSGWSAFSPKKRADTISAPAARYLQMKVRMSSDGSHAPVIRKLEAAYRNRNAAPVVESLVALNPNEVFARSASGGSNVFETTSPDDKGIFTSLEEQKSESAPRRLLRKGYRTLTWRATDSDSDPLTYDLEFRPESSNRWMTLRRNLKETFYSFDTTSLPDGEYVFRVTASDAEANPEEKKTGSRESTPVRIDNTPPVIRKLSATATAFEFEASDTASPILEAEYSVDAKEWIRIEPKDGLSDSQTESYSIPLDAKSKGGFLLIRVTDASHNVAAASFPLN
jgi:streptogramin lyase